MELENTDDLVTFLNSQKANILQAWSFKTHQRYSQESAESNSFMTQDREIIFTALIDYFSSGVATNSPQVSEILWGNTEYLTFMETLFEFLEKQGIVTPDLLLRINNFFDAIGFTRGPEEDAPSKLLLESAAECLFGLDDVGNCTYANPSCLQLLGYESADDILGKNLHRLIHYKHQDGTEFLEEECPIYRSYIYGEKVHLENEVLWRADGTQIFVDYRAHPILQGDEVTGAVVSVTDVTSRKRAEEDLRENQEMLRDYFIQFPLPMALFISEDYYFKHVNKPYEDLFGMSLSGKRLRDVLPHEQAQKFIHLMNEVYRSGDAYEGKELPFIRPADGGLHYVDIVYTPLRNKIGIIIGLMTTIIDVTEKVLSRQQIAESEARFKAISEKNPQIIWTCSPTGKVTFIGEAWTEMTGIPIEEVKDQGWENMVHPEDRERMIHEFQTSLKAGSPSDLEYRLCCRKDRSYKWVMTRSHPIKNDQGEIIEWVGITANINTLKESQRALYDQAQFEQHLVGIISHDLRSPLTAIENACTLLVRNFNRNTEEKNQKLLGIINNSAKRTISMVKDLLDFTRGRLTQFPLIPSPFQLSDAIHPIIEELRLSHYDRPLLVEAHSPIRVEWDYPRFQQMIQNLLTNALKYSPRGSPVQIGFREDPSSVQIWVRNYGPPIPSEIQKEIFEPLQRKASEAGNEERSLGLGLHIVKKLSEAHGGKVSVSSSQDAGTVFTLHLPKKAHSPLLIQ